MCGAERKRSQGEALLLEPKVCLTPGNLVWSPGPSRDSILRLGPSTRLPKPGLLASIVRKDFGAGVPKAAPHLPFRLTVPRSSFPQTSYIDPGSGPKGAAYYMAMRNGSCQSLQDPWGVFESCGLWVLGYSRPSVTKWADPTSAGSRGDRLVLGCKE